MSAIKVMSKVRLVSDPSAVGIVCGMTEMGGTIRYEVFLNGDTRIFYSEQIVPLDAAPSENRITPDQLFRCITAYQINTPSSETLYSMNSGRIDFIPYQFRPVLKLLRSDEPRILIADSVGVGKTIEAGLIIKELEAQRQIESILVICPKPLVSEEKWTQEMARFDEHFTAVNKQELLHILDETARDGQWPLHSRKLVIPYSILDEQTYQPSQKEHTVRHACLKDLYPSPHFDLVIVDEAHHIRNGSMEKEKAYNYKCVKYFCERSDAVVMLTATPIQNSDSDLYTLLNVLRPELIVDRHIFSEMSAPNKAITKCAHILRTQKGDWQHDAWSALQDIHDTQWGHNVVIRNPLYQSVCSRLKGAPLSRSERVQLIHDVEALHTFDSMINRTRRRDIQDFCVRRTESVRVSMTPAQQDLHDSLLQFEAEALGMLHGDQGVAFMMSTIKRQAASCIFGLTPFLRDLLQRRLDQLECFDGFDETAMNGLPKWMETEANKIMEQANHLPEEDPKLDALLEVVSEVNARENNKMILFSSFRHTLRYLNRQLATRGYRIGQIDGSVSTEDRQTIRKRFELSKTDPEALDILLFTEVGSEGLDYQFCDTMLNYDLPWNPMRIEQRIGRIDRRGQKSDVVHIYNLITEDTIDADIYDRCLLRIGIFERSIGDCEAILGEISQKIEKIAIDPNLTEKERRDKLEQIADNQIREVQELERLEDAQKDLYGISLSEDVLAKEVRDAENQWVLPDALDSLVTSYLQDEITGGRSPWQGSGELRRILLSKVQRESLLEKLTELQKVPSDLRASWEAYLKGIDRTHEITFSSDTAKEEPRAFLLSPVHPLVRTAALETRLIPNAVVSIRVIDSSLPAGNFPFSIYIWHYTGFKEKNRIVPVCAEKSIAENLTRLLKEGADSAQSSFEFDWKKQEQEHIALWQKARKEEIQEADSIAAYRMETLNTNSKIQQDIYKQKMAQFEDIPSMHRMYDSMLREEQENLEIRLKKVEARHSRTDIQTILLARGTVSIRRGQI